MDIRELVEPEDADLDAWHTLVSAAHLHDLPGDPAPDSTQTIGRIFGGGARRLWAVPYREGFGAVASVWLPGDPAVRAAEVDVHVLPELRRRGLGTRLLRLAAEAARANGRSAALAQALAGTPAVPFLERHGFRCLLITRSLVLRPAETDVSAHAALNPEGYRLIRWTGTVPDHLAVQFALAKSAMADHDEGDSAWTADVVRDTADHVAKRGDDLYTVAALHGPRIVGFTEVVVPGDVPVRAFQYDTAVVPGHRGRRIGLWVKAAMLEWLADERPEVVEIETDNAGDNAHMLAVNEALGYRPLREFREYLAQAADLP
ncbi:acetyltransferase (GNAT) family protein [Actinocorallia herbida]|uniref:Acetyltransferase (GNAT) family protein n=1 Tax=Actinocorallia herbida TaxID=58109 RepID=A0A3N1CSB2_9ACTN|nr:GNAT family N-acetyltransferase [Actinocorallia herbida]ROO84209.1 acetyltransferase (GNAT) family protein [Actinocorallia herbida]